MNVGSPGDRFHNFCKVELFLYENVLDIGLNYRKIPIVNASESGCHLRQHRVCGGCGFEGEIRVTKKLLKQNHIFIVIIYYIQSTYPVIKVFS